MSSIVAPEGYRLHSENGANLLLPPSNEAFLNPVQEFNRDLSVAAIRVWSEQLNEFKEKRWNDKQKRNEEKGLKPPEKKRKKGTTCKRPSPFVLMCKSCLKTRSRGSVYGN
jgi:tRNA (guanine26-N2/guanine27-N2)-dimethyltransferase